MDYPGLEEITNGHLVVEHGLNNTAVITFLKRTHPFVHLPRDRRLRLLAISYNHLVDWHLFPDQDGLITVFNRSDPLATTRIFTSDDPDVFQADAFERIANRRPNPNLKNLDSTLIETISIWKRALAADLGQAVSLTNLSALFNSILFVRALEDHKRFAFPNMNKALIDTWRGMTDQTPTIRSCVTNCLLSLGAAQFPEAVLDAQLLSVFDSVDRQTGEELFGDFYQNRFAPYHYDFSLMSKHALSRIYEKYVALLREPESPQLSLFAALPEEESAVFLGSVYTPQYIARFFARFLKDNLTPRMFRQLAVSDPACGSGIFLRTVLEMQCDPFRSENIQVDTIERAFTKVLGIDWDANACHATRLSLALLHLVLTGSFPKTLKIEHAEAIEFAENHPDLRDSYDAVIANPPFIKWDHLPEELRTRVNRFMKGYSVGKIDMFLAHLRLGLELVKPGGHCLYVLPHSFLIGRNAAAMRKDVGARCWIRCLVDLSEIAVFGDVGSYVILLIAQKKSPHLGEEPKATVVRCREFPGHALNDALEGKSVSTEFYQVFEVEQARFADSNWNILPPLSSGLNRKLDRLPRLRDFLAVREGFVTGADDIFIVDNATIPAKERQLYASFLSDREMERYSVPEATAKSVFYPYVGEDKLGEDELRSAFPETWKYLERHRDKLEQRSSVVQGNVPWWCPERPRKPSNMMRPKIVSPHLIVLPRFSLDADGRFAVSHCPLMYPRGTGNEVEMLRYFLAILNSAVSLSEIVRLSHKYRRGYAMLEPKTLNAMPVPDPATVSVGTMRQIQRLVAQRIETRVPENDRQLDRLVADIFGLTREERRLIGMDGTDGDS